MRADDVFAILNKKIKNVQVSGDGVSDYEDLNGKPQINGVTLQGNVTLEDLGIVEMMNESAGTPVGEIISYMGNTVPENYLACDGSEYHISEYQELANHFLKEFGSVNYFGGDGESTFAVPDLRGEFLRGTGTAGRDSGSGSGVGVHQDATQNLSLGYDPHYKTFYHGAEDNSGGKYDVEYNCDKFVYSNNTTGRSVQTTGTYEGTGIRTYSTRPTNTSVLYCIKYESTCFVKAETNLSNIISFNSDGNLVVSIDGVSKVFAPQ